MDDASLAPLARAVKQLAACTSLAEVKKIHDIAKAALLFARAQRLGEQGAADAAEIVALALQELGDRMAQMQKAKTPGVRRAEPSGPTPTRGDNVSTSHPSVPTLADQGIDKHTADSARKAHKKTPAQRAAHIASVRQRAAKAVNSVASGVSDAPEYDGDTWETPDETLELVRAVLGTIDLDAASNAHAQKRVRATRWFSAKDNALEQSWGGNVFCNPPYSMPLIEQFGEKLIAEYDAKRIKQAIYLVNNCTDAAWCQSLLQRFPVCFTRGRINFLQGDGQKFATRQGQAIFYAGPRVAKFIEVFSQIGTVLQALS
jgi:phage N-6-adenine-methyltransferase